MTGFARNIYVTDAYAERVADLERRMQNLESVAGFVRQHKRNETATELTVTNATPIAPVNVSLYVPPQCRVALCVGCTIRQINNGSLAQTNLHIQELTDPTDWFATARQWGTQNITGLAGPTGALNVFQINPRYPAGTSPYALPVSYFPSGGAIRTWRLYVTRSGAGGATSVLDSWITAEVT